MRKRFSCTIEEGLSKQAPFENLTSLCGLNTIFSRAKTPEAAPWYRTPHKAMAKKMSKRVLSLLHSDEHVLGILNQTNEFLETTKSDVADRTTDSVWILRSLHDLLPETTESIWSGHIFPLSEAAYELESSIVFCKLGFYKHAIGCLRNVLELGLLSVYWDIEGQSHIDIQTWLRSLESTPFRKNVFAKLKRNQNILTFDKMHRIFEETSQLYEELCNFAHTKGIRFSSRALSPSNINVFHEGSIKLWLDFLLRVMRTVAAFHILKYPVALQYTPIDDKFGLKGPTGGFLLPFQADRIRSLYSTEVAATLQTISDNDSVATSMAEWVNAKPDLTGEEWQAQVESQDQQEIEAWGFERWLENGRGTFEFLKEVAPDEYPKRLAYVERMRAWARKHGFLKKEPE